MTKYLLFILLSFLFCSYGAAAAVEPKKQLLEKTPKSLFLIKKTRISSQVGEPQFYPGDAQLRTVINDSLLHNTKKFE